MFQKSAPRHSLELSFGERFFATYRCIEIKANKNGVLIFQSSVLCLQNSDTDANLKINASEAICSFSALNHFGPKHFRPNNTESTLKGAAILKSALGTNRCIDWSKRKKALQKSAPAMQLSPGLYLLLLHLVLTAVTRMTTVQAKR